MFLVTKMLLNLLYKSDPIVLTIIQMLGNAKDHCKTPQDRKGQCLNTLPFLIHISLSVLQYLLTRCWYLSIVIVKDKTRRCLINTWLHTEDGDLVTNLNIMYKLELNTFNNMSVLSWRSVLLVEETRGTRPLS